MVKALGVMGADVTWAAVVELVDAPAPRVQAETEALLASDPAALVITTAGGLERWARALGANDHSLMELMGRVPVAARGYKAERACAETGRPAAITARTERGPELAPALAAVLAEGATVGVQVDGGGSAAVLEALTCAGLPARTVRPYRWAAPADLAPAEHLVGQCLAGEIDVMCFTSAPAVHGLFEVAADLGAAEQLREALSSSVEVAAIGPVTAEAVEARGALATVCPAQPRTDALVGALLSSRRLPRQPLGLRLDAERQSATLYDRTVQFSALEFCLLVALARRHQLTCPTEVLLREVWGDGGDRRRLEALVSRLRSRVAGLGLAITTVPKRGYRLQAALPL